MVSNETQELLELCEQLPQAKRAEVADFARFLLAREHESEGDRRWEEIIASPQLRPRLDEFLKQSATEGAEPRPARLR